MGFFKNINANIPILTYSDDGQVWDGDEWITPSKKLGRVGFEFGSRLGTLPSVKELCQYIPEKDRMIFCSDTKSTYIGCEFVEIISTEPIRNIRWISFAGIRGTQVRNY